MPWQRKDPQDCDCHVGLTTELEVNMLQMPPHRPRTHAENEPDLVNSLALGHPAKDIGLSRGEAQEPAKHLLSQHQGIRNPLLPAS